MKTNLSVIMKEKGIDTPQLARATGISLDTLKSLRCGRNDINKTSFRNIYLISKALGTSMNSIVETKRLKASVKANDKSRT